jgi:hypothetical protein
MIMRNYVHRYGHLAATDILSRLIISSILAELFSLIRRSQWPRDLRGGSAAPHSLGLWV